MIMVVTREQAKQRYESRFKGYKLIEYRGSDRPCVIRCPKHGKVQSLRYSSIARSKTGCPLCGLESVADKRSNNGKSIITKLIDPTPYSLAFAERFKEEKERLNLKPQTLANKTLIPKTVITKIEQGVTHTNSIYLYNLHTVGFDVLYLLTGKRKPKTLDKG